MQCIQCNCIAYKQAPRNHFVRQCVRILGFDQGIELMILRVTPRPWIRWQWWLTILRRWWGASLFSIKCPSPSFTEYWASGSPSSTSSKSTFYWESSIESCRQQAFDVGDILSGKVSKGGLPRAMKYNFLQNHHRPADVAWKCLNHTPWTVSKRYYRMQEKSI